MYIGIFVFRLLKHSYELNLVITTNPAGGRNNTFTGGGGHGPLYPSRWLRPCICLNTVQYIGYN